MKNASVPVRLLASLLTIGVLFFGIAAVALNFGGDGEVTAEDTSTTSTSQSTSTSASSDSSEPAESPKPSLQGVVVAPDALKMPSTTTSTDAPSAPSSTEGSSSRSEPKPTTPTTAAPPPPPSAEVPADAVVVNPGDNIQQLVNSHPAGTTFFLRAGVHRAPGGATHVAPKTGNTFVGEPGAIMDGAGSTTRAFYDSGGAPDVTIRGLVIRKYRNRAETGAIDSGSGGWRLIGNEIHGNSGAGISFGGSNWLVEGNHIHHNDQIGILGMGSGGRVLSNTIANNNPNRAYDWSWEAGGTKFIKTTNLRVAGNKVLNNNGPGLWTDGNNQGTVYENNIVRDNAGPGIFHEISGSATIRNNTVSGNAHPFYVGGILIANSSDVTVTGNSLSGNDGGIIGLQDDRGSSNTVNLTVTGNSVSHSGGVSGLIHNSGADVAATGTIRFDQNHYSVGGNRPFSWKGGGLTVAEWQGLGQDTNSTFN